MVWEDDALCCLAPSGELLLRMMEAGGSAKVTGIESFAPLQKTVLYSHTLRIEALYLLTAREE